jgi:hypothetical protein
VLLFVVAHDGLGAKLLDAPYNAHRIWTSIDEIPAEDKAVLALVILQDANQLIQLLKASMNVSYNYFSTILHFLFSSP